MKKRACIHSNDKGFTLVELIIAAAVTLIVIAGLSALWSTLRNTWLAEEIKSETQQNARVAMDTMVREMMMMGYGSRTKILMVNDESIMFEEHVPRPTVTDATNTEAARIAYYLEDALNANGETIKVLKRSEKIVGSVEPTDYQDIAENVVSLKFDYYNKGALSTAVPADNYGVDWDPSWGTDPVQGDPSADPTTAAYGQGMRDEIRRIIVTLRVQSDRKVPTLNVSDKTNWKRQVITLKADLSPRNLWEGETSSETNPPLAVTWLKVRDSGRCGTLKLQWEKNVEPDLKGYLIKYGLVSGNWTAYLEVPAVKDDEPNQTKEVTGLSTQLFTDDLAANAYYFTIQAYDGSYNYSPELTTPVGGADPFPNITGFEGDANDSACSIPKPAAPADFRAFNSYSGTPTYDRDCPENAVILRWTPSTDPNVLGYRIYRWRGAALSFPIQASVLLTKETDAGDGLDKPRTDKGGSSTGTWWDYTDGEFIDRDPNLVGCADYNYAICAVTCDNTRIYGFDDPSKDSDRGGRYGEAQFSSIIIAPHEHTPPSAPGMEARAGWKRVFLQMVWPSDDDYAYTEIYFKEGTIALGDDLASTISDNDLHLIVDRQTGYNRGTFKNFGTSAANTIVFNTAGDIDIGDTEQPQLDNGVTYSFLAVSYDKCGNTQSVLDVATTFAELCGDDPCGAPAWTTPIAYSADYVNSDMWVDPANTEQDSSKWDSGNADGNTQINVGFKWTDIDKADPDRGLDFYGYNVSTDVSPSGSFGNAVSVGEWNNFVQNTGLVEGQTYCYRVQAADCVWANITEGDTVYCPEDTEMTDGHGYQYIRDTNITKLEEGPYIDYLRPGKFRQFSDGTDTQFNFATTSGSFHHFVIFYLQNTSASPMEIESMWFNWLNPSVYLEAITIEGTGSSADAAVTYPAGVGVYTEVAINRTINDVARGVNDYSIPIKVTLLFRNSGAAGTVNELTDMRGDVIEWEVKFKNLSMPKEDGTAVGGFTTGAIKDSARVQSFGVLGGPVVNRVTQNQPSNPTESLAVRANSLPPVVPEVGGRIPVRVTASVTKPSVETITGVWLAVVKTLPTSVNVSGSTSLLDVSGRTTWIQMTKSGSDYVGTIDFQVDSGGTTHEVEDCGIWFSVNAYTEQGSTIRDPLRTNWFYYYKLLPFDPCYVTPNPPTGLDSTTIGTDVTLTWTAPTKYDSGLMIDPDQDTLVYDVYRRSLTGSFPPTPLASGLTDTTYATDTLAGVAYVYAVKARNSCDMESEFSNEEVVCAGTGCTVRISPSYVTVDTDWTSGSETATPQTANLAVFICDRAGDHKWWDGTAPGFGDSLLDVSGDPLSDITMQVYTAESYPAYTRITLYEIADTGVFTMTGTSDSAVYIDPTNDNYDNGLRNSEPVASTDKASRTFGATTIDSLDDTVTFITESGITGCEDVSGTLAVKTNPCANTPMATTLLSGYRPSSNKAIYLKVEPVTRNTDGSIATSSTDGITYNVWCVGTGDSTSTPRQASPVAAAPQTDGTVKLTFDLPVSSAEAGNSFDFYVTVSDNCSNPSPNVSEPSNAGTLIKGTTSEITF